MVRLLSGERNYKCYKLGMKAGLPACVLGPSPGPRREGVMSVQVDSTNLAPQSIPHQARPCENTGTGYQQSPSLATSSGSSCHTGGNCFVWSLSLPLIPQLRKVGVELDLCGFPSSWLC